MSVYLSENNEINKLFADPAKMYRRMVEYVKTGIYMADDKGHLFYVNQAFCDMLGYDHKDEVLNLNIAQDLYVDPEERKDFLKEMEKKGFVQDYAVKTRRKDGSVVILEATSHLIRNESGKVIGVEGVVHEITERKRLEERLLTEKKKLEEILSFDEKISTMHKVNDLTDFVAKKVLAILGAEKCSIMLLDETSQELCIKSAIGIDENIVANTRIKVGEDISGFVAREKRAILVRNIEYDREFERKNRPSYRGRSFMSTPLKIRNEVIGVINVADKHPEGRESFNELDLKLLCAIARQTAVAIENAELYKEMEYLSVTDPLTSLSNYRAFIRSVDEEIMRDRRFGGGLCMIMIDVDDFKSYNDTFGHLEGDNLLKAIGNLLRSNLRGIDKICRYGGDEFVVLLPRTNQDQARLVAEKIRERLHEEIFKMPVTVSVGVAQYNNNLSRFEFTMRADRAMYQAKENGKDQVSVFNL